MLCFNIYDTYILFVHFLKQKLVLQQAQQALRQSMGLPTQQQRQMARQGNGEVITLDDSPTKGKEP